MKKFIVAVAAIAMMAGSAYAADWNFYGSSRVATFYNNVEKINPAVATADKKNIAQNLQGNARIGAKVKVSDELSGRFEYGTGVNVRLLYGVWNFGAGTFLVGQDYTPLYLPGSNQVYATDNGLGGWGEIYGSRKAQLKLQFGGFEIAAVAPNTKFTEDSTVDAFGSTTTEVKLPQFQARYTMSADTWRARAVGGYATFEVDPNGVGEDVSSYYLGIGGDLYMGAFTLTAQVHGGVNPGNLIFVDTNGNVTDDDDKDSTSGFAKFDTTTNKVIDNEAFGWRATVAYTFNDMFGLELGYGYMETEYDEPSADSDEVKSYYLQAPITLAPGVFVIPEVGVVDYNEDEQTETTYFGAKWQINF